ncbi:hypothetical protein [Iodobacter ciconiae]|uniref:Uncharacterized protein n=1 Tax=Iodobacter ciconiae TaxID=2496266 RepID=A0A3S8ZVZ7_9NEIS|nr:hypothetical protein [Iodobacter ciconiae]AZN37651.1 hypothetical protein EJO50_14960 [Iodobacter ciconiae]
MSNHRIYTDLVQDPQDFVGRVAYTFYKEEKINWIETFKTNNNVAEPPLDQFHSFARSPQKILEYRERAEREVNEIVDQVAAAEIQQQVARLRNDKIVQTVNKGWGRSIAENVIAGLIGSIITIAFSMFAWLYLQMQDSEKREKLSSAAIEQLHQRGVPPIAASSAAKK